jgi:hypothetical protein
MEPNIFVSVGTFKIFAESNEHESFDMGSLRTFLGAVLRLVPLVCRIIAYILIIILVLAVLQSTAVFLTHWLLNR